MNEKDEMESDSSFSSSDSSEENRAEDAAMIESIKKKIQEAFEVKEDDQERSKSLSRGHLFTYYDYMPNEMSQEVID